MKIFHLPDLAEGLTDAEIHEWHIKEGDIVTLDQPVVAMETAKAVVDVPAPRAGIIGKFYGLVGDTINTGAPLFEYTDDLSVTVKSEHTSERADNNSVVGNLHQSETIILDAIGKQSTTSNNAAKVKALPAVRALARKLKVDIAQLVGSGSNGQITQSDVEKAAKSTTKLEGAEPLRGVRKAMAQAMIQSHAEVVSVTIVEDADIHSWPKDTDISLRIIRAMVVACQKVPALNAWFDGSALARQLHKKINLGIAMDSNNELFVPVIKDVANLDDATIRQTINRFKQEVHARTIAPTELLGSSIMLSNFGTFAGRYANPIVVPPLVAILGTGRLREQVMISNGEMQSHRILPLSLSFDHRAVTGGEAAQFLAAVVDSLQSE